MARFLVHLVAGPSDPDRATVAFLLARTAAEEGHKVTVFLTGEAVTLLSPDAAEMDVLGPGRLCEHVEAIRDSNVDVYVGGLSTLARGIRPGELVIDRAQPGLPSTFIALAAAADTVLTF